MLSTHRLRASLLAALLLCTLPLCGQELGTATRYRAMSLQADSLLGGSFARDGQEWFGLARQGQVYKVTLTLYANVHYRLLTLAQNDKTAVHYTIYDADRNLLFDNRPYGMKPWWDFKSSVPLVCQVELELPSTNHSKKPQSYVLLRLAFKDHLSR